MVHCYCVLELVATQVPDNCFYRCEIKTSEYRCYAHWINFSTWVFETRKISFTHMVNAEFDNLYIIFTDYRKIHCERDVAHGINHFSLQKKH